MDGQLLIRQKLREMSDVQNNGALLRANFRFTPEIEVSFSFISPEIISGRQLFLARKS